MREEVRQSETEIIHHQSGRLQNAASAYRCFPDDRSGKLLMKENTAYVSFQMLKLLIVTCLA